MRRGESFFLDERCAAILWNYQKFLKINFSKKRKLGFLPYLCPEFLHKYLDL